MQKIILQASSALLTQLRGIKWNKNKWWWWLYIWVRHKHKSFIEVGLMWSGRTYMKVRYISIINTQYNKMVNGKLCETSVHIYHFFMHDSTNNDVSWHTHILFPLVQISILLISLLLLVFLLRFLYFSLSCLM